MRRGLEESVAECVDHLQFGVQVEELYVLNIYINNDKVLAKCCISYVCITYCYVSGYACLSLNYAKNCKIYYYLLEFMALMWIY